jgi:formamidopyrimidine-DNA glycosylase
MPELPEVETIRRHLAPRVEGRVLHRLEILDARWTAPEDPRAVEDQLAGRLIERLGRRGKYLVATFDGDAHLLMHLRMTGTLLYDPPLGNGPDAAPAHGRVRFTLDEGRRLVFIDPRRFGTGRLLHGDRQLEQYLAVRLGLDPLGPAFTAAALKAMARGRVAPVKAFLLDQRRIAGVGNIYADEALFRARIHPLRPAGRLSLGQWRDLRDAVVEALEAGLAAGGATIDDYRTPEGVQGSFQNEFLVHTRAGEACPECGRAIVKLRAAGRGTYVCERCQPRPRAPRRPVVSTWGS